MKTKLQEQKRSKFLPMLCSSSKEVKLSHRRSSSSDSVSDDPSSPKVGCMGQVKRNNKVAGFPSIISFTTSFSFKNNSTPQKTEHHNNSNAVYLRRLFSSRNLGEIQRSRATGVVHNRARGTDGRHRRTSSMTDLKDSYTNNGNGTYLDLEKLDPPLPVVKQVDQKQNQKQDLWKRRSGGAPLKTLQLQTCTLPSANTV